MSPARPRASKTLRQLEHEVSAVLASRHGITGWMDLRDDLLDQFWLQDQAERLKSSTARAKRDHRHHEKSLKLDAQRRRVLADIQAEDWYMRPDCPWL